MAKRKHNTSWHRYTGVAVAIAMVIPMFLWILIDTGNRVGDQVFYKILAIRLYDALTHDFVIWKQICLNALPSKAPLQWVLGQFFVPLGRLFGSVNIGLLSMNILFTAGAGALMYRILMKLYDNLWIAVIGVIILLGMPLTFSLTVEFWREPLQMLLITSFIALFIFRNEFDVITFLLLTIILAALSLLAKASMPFYLVWLTPFFVFRIIAKQDWNAWKRSHIIFFLIALYSVIQAYNFYDENAEHVLSFVQYVTTTDNYNAGLGTGFWHTLHYWVRSVIKNASVILSILAACLLILAVFKRSSWNKEGAFLALLSFLQVLFCLIMFSRTSNSDVRFIMPLSPYVVLIMCFVLSTVYKRWMMAPVLLVAVVRYVVVAIIALTGSNIVGANIYYDLNLRPALRKADNEQLKTFSELDAMLNVTDSTIIYFNTMPVFLAKNYEYHAMSKGIFTPRDVSMWQDLEINYDMYMYSDSVTSNEIFYDMMMSRKPDYLIVHNPALDTDRFYDHNSGWFKNVIPAVNYTIERILQETDYNCQPLRDEKYILLTKP